MSATRDLIFVFADHFEPEGGMAEWLAGYPRMAEKFRDADGRPPRHTWFYDGEDPRVLGQLATLARQGMGEVEMHLHHGNDTAESLTEKIEARKALYAQYGALVTTDDPSQRRYGFVHGKWSLANSRGDEFCGVNEEIGVLARTGCYADFTFPAWGRMNPRKRNSIYYASEDASRPKSYDWGDDAETGKAPSGDLMIFQGPGDVSGIPARFARRWWLRRAIDLFWLTTDITNYHPGSPGRVDRWVRRGVCVKGRPEMVFVKVQTHGARPDAFDACFGSRAEELYSYLSDRYNDGDAWRLHYATAREAYNMVKAAEGGESGDPGRRRDYEVGPYQNTR